MARAFTPRQKVRTLIIFRNAARNGERAIDSRAAGWATCSRSPSSIFANDDTRPTFVIAAPVRGC
eukprot:scaffold68667_cov33-Phaeocystis_antarctica.AAC.2